MTRSGGGKALLFIESNTSGTGRLFIQAAREMGFRPVLITAKPKKYAFLAADGAPQVIRVLRTDEDTLHALDGAPLRRAGGRGRDHQHLRVLHRHGGGAGGAPRPAGPGRRLRPRGAGQVAPARGAGGRRRRHPRLPRGVVDGPGGGRGAGDRLSRRRQAGGRKRERRGSRLRQRSRSPHSRGGALRLGAPPFFVEAGHDYPARVPAETARALAEAATLGTELLGLGWGPLHWELRMAADGRAVPIEVNPRLAGGFIPDLVRHAEGIDLIRETLRLVAGRTPEVDALRHRHASIRFLFAPAAGRLQRVDGIGEAEGAEGVVDVALYRAAGDALAIHGDFRDCVGHVMACADDGGGAARAAERGRDAVRVVLAAPAEEMDDLDDLDATRDEASSPSGRTAGEAGAVQAKANAGQP